MRRFLDDPFKDLAFLLLLSLKERAEVDAAVTLSGVDNDFPLPWERVVITWLEYDFCCLKLRPFFILLDSRLVTEWLSCVSWKWKEKGFVFGLDSRFF